jgi:hypothetical protein
MTHAFFKSIFFLFWAYVFADLYSPQVEYFSYIYIGFLLFAIVTTETANRFLNAYDSQIYAFYIFNPVVYVILFMSQSFITGFYLAEYLRNAWCLKLILFTLFFWIYIKTLSKKTLYENRVFFYNPILD